MKCKDCACSEVCYYKAFNDVRAVKRRDDVEKVCKSFVHRDSIKVDDVPVVRCKDCKWRNTRGCPYMNFNAAVRDDSDYCSDGERKENE